MLNALQQYLAKLPSTQSVSDLVLPRIAGRLQEEFLYWIDGGAGVGTSAKGYAAVQDASLDTALLEHARVFCYEPLPENVIALRQYLAGEERFVVRDVAVSSRAGEASFTVPSRISSTGAGPWVPGTSFAGSLRHSATASESITVRTVRLDEEEVPRYDFVKLDLQGAEIDALQGMGERLHEVKLFHVEAQLLHDWGALRFLNDRGFALFYDRLQFGFKQDLTYVPLEVLSGFGIHISRIHLPQRSGMPLICWGYFESNTDVIDSVSLVLKEEVSKKLLSSGLSYLQTDVLAVNARWLPQIAPCLLP
jgi:FkbM family methyltransferase